VTAPIDQIDWQNPQTGMSLYATVLDQLSLAPAASSGIIDLSAYSSYTLWLIDASFNGAVIAILDPDSNKALWVLSTPPDIVGTTGVPVRAPVTTKRIRLVNSGTETLRVSLTATTRIATGPPSAFSIIDVDSLDLPSQAINATVLLGYGRGYGAAFAQLGASGATITGQFFINSGASQLTIADTAEMHTNPFGGRDVTKQLVMPRGVWTLSFQPFTTATASLRARFIYAG
jgi:hypothetical protein